MRGSSVLLSLVSAHAFVGMSVAVAVPSDECPRDSDTSSEVSNDELKAETLGGYPVAQTPEPSPFVDQETERTSRPSPSPSDEGQAASEAVTGVQATCLDSSVDLTWISPTEAVLPSQLSGLSRSTGTLSPATLVLGTEYVCEGPGDPVAICGQGDIAALDVPTEALSADRLVTGGGVGASGRIPVMVRGASAARHPISVLGRERNSLNGMQRAGMASSGCALSSVSTRTTSLLCGEIRVVATDEDPPSLDRSNGS